MRHLSKVVPGLACLAMLGACGSDPPPAQPTTPPPSIAAANVSPGSVFVRYELTGTAVTFDGSYSEPAGDAERSVDLRAAALPWSKSFALPAKRLFVAGLVAQAPNLESTITCRIVKDGAIIAEETGPTVDCRAEIS